MSTERALWTAYCIADGLIHLNDVVHCNLKPANVLLRAPVSGGRLERPEALGSQASTPDARRC